MIEILISLFQKTWANALKKTVNKIYLRAKDIKKFYTVKITA